MDISQTALVEDNVTCHYYIQDVTPGSSAVGLIYDQKDLHCVTVRVSPGSAETLVRSGGPFDSTVHLDQTLLKLVDVRRS